MYDIYDMKTLLQIIFKYTKKNARILADQYLLKDVSIISKWRNNVIYPRNDDIIKIVEFVENEATSSQKELIRDNIEELLKKAPIKNKIKEIILDTKDFSEFLKEAISVAMPEYEPECEEKSKRIIKKENPSEKKEAYSGTVKLDFVLPEGSDINLQKLANSPGIKFNGVLNLTPKKKTLKVANFFKSSTALGILLVWIISGTIIIAFSGSMQKNNSATSASKDNALYNSDISDTEESNEYDTPVEDENFDVSSPLPESSPIPESKEVDTLDVASEEEIKEKEILTTDNQANSMVKSYEQNTITNNINESHEHNTTNNITETYEQNTTNNTQINSWNNFNIQISGENLNLVVGEQNAVSIEAE
ncbi:hypothetical protein [Acetivibrio straminisolvens]|jgi:hypothetical protein|uniref:Uncharacterized protein n=1 Tax=Acetivibrio straminisolvens JCM 21531 TaxID=1294263 RepID=W4V689_9FIRM|nr:hypothetical protein [Acetivibrio straminisolvens]GAE88264.1 hypothetical protein JCM21531_1696 [Acetivibrio straminisolvens JCM 21531]